MLLNDPLPPSTDTSETAFLFVTDVFVLIVFANEGKTVLLMLFFVVFPNSLTAIIHNVLFGKVANSFRANYLIHTFESHTDNQYINEVFF